MAVHRRPAVPRGPDRAATSVAHREKAVPRLQVRHPQRAACKVRAARRPPRGVPSRAARPPKGEPHRRVGLLRRAEPSVTAARALVVVPLLGVEGPPMRARRESVGLLRSRTVLTG